MISSSLYKEQNIWQRDGLFCTNLLDTPLMPVCRSDRPWGLLTFWPSDLLSMDLLFPTLQSAFAIYTFDACLQVRQTMRRVMPILDIPSMQTMTDYEAIEASQFCCQKISDIPSMQVQQTMSQQFRGRTRTHVLFSRHWECLLAIPSYISHTHPTSIKINIPLYNMIIIRTIIITIIKSWSLVCIVFLKWLALYYLPFAVFSSNNSEEQFLQCAPFTIHRDDKDDDLNIKERPKCSRKKTRIFYRYNLRHRYGLTIWCSFFEKRHAQMWTILTHTRHRHSRISRKKEHSDWMNLHSWS